MGSCTLKDGTPVLMTIGTDGYPYVSLDRGATFTLASKVTKYAPGVNVITMNGTGLTAAGRDERSGIHLLHIADAKNPATGFRDQPIGGTGSGTPSITNTPDGLLLSVRGSLTTAANAGRIYVKTVRPDGTVKDWAPTAGRAR